jgi:hypothetical protein
MGIATACASPQSSAEAEQMIRKGLSIFEKDKKDDLSKYAKAALATLNNMEVLCKPWGPEPSFHVLPDELLRQPERGKAKDIKISAAVEKRFRLPDGKALHLTTPENWIEQIPNNGPQGSVYNIDFNFPQADGDGQMRLSLAVQSSETQDIKASIERTQNYLLKISAEKEISIVPFDAKSARGYYLIATDKDLVDKTPQPGNYKYILSSIIGEGRYVGLFSVFSNQKDREFLNRIVDVLKSWRID